MVMIIMMVRDGGGEGDHDDYDGDGSLECLLSISIITSGYLNNCSAVHEQLFRYPAVITLTLTVMSVIACSAANGDDDEDYEDDNHGRDGGVASTDICNREQLTHS